MFDLTIKTGTESLLKKFPETIDTESGNKARLSSPKFIITEWEDKVSVGVTVYACERLFAPTENGFNVTDKSNWFGEYEYLPANCTIEDIVKTANNLVDEVLKTIVAWG